MGRYAKGPPIKFRSISEIYGQYSKKPEYRPGKHSDNYGKFQEKYEPASELKIERSSESRMPNYNDLREQLHLESERKIKEHTNQDATPYDSRPEKKTMNPETQRQVWVNCSLECNENSADGKPDPKCKVCFGDGYEILRKENRLENGRIDGYG